MYFYEIRGAHALAVDKFGFPAIKNWLSIAPILPEAADIPWQVERYRVGNSSPGIMNVVVFGPKFMKKPARQKRKSMAFVPDFVPNRGSHDGSELGGSENDEMPICGNIAPGGA